MDYVKPTEEVWEMAFPEMDDVRERSQGTRFGKRRFPKWMTPLGHATSRLKVTLCNENRRNNTSLMICKSVKLEIGILITIGIVFEAEVLNEFGIFILFESENQTARSPNKNDRTAKVFKFDDETLSISALTALKLIKDFEDAG